MTLLGLPAGASVLLERLPPLVVAAPAVGRAAPARARTAPLPSLDPRFPCIR